MYLADTTYQKNSIKDPVGVWFLQVLLYSQLLFGEASMN